jgi:hypothetical protein
MLETPDNKVFVDIYMPCSHLQYVSDGKFIPVSKVGMLKTKHPPKSGH